jgi:hypothetical protein
MATVKKRGNSYQIIVSCGYDVRGKRIRHCTTWVIPKDMAPTKVQKALQDEVYRFESRCKNAPAMPRMKFENYLNNVNFPKREPETGIDPLKRKTFDT